MDMEIIEVKKPTFYKKVNRLAMCMSIFLLASLAPVLASAADIYLHPNGNDQSGDGSLSSPYRSLLGAKNSRGSIAPGTRIQLRGGTFNWDVAQHLPLIGTASEPIVITAYENELPKLDGRGIPQLGGIGEENRSVINLLASRHVIVENLEVIGSSGRGISFYDSEHVVIRNNKVHDVQSRAIGGSGAHITIEGNTVWNGSQHNVGGRSNGNFRNGGWSGVIMTYLRPGNRLSSDIIIKNNRVYDSWGEGIISFWADGIVVSGNTVHDTYSVNFYIDHSRNVTLTGNHAYSSDSTYYRDGVPAHGVSIANERYNDTIDGLLSSTDILIANNLLVNTRRGVSFWFDSRNQRADNTYRNLTVANNTISGSWHAAIHAASVGWRTADGIFRNNSVDAPAATQLVAIEDLDNWTFSHNNWVQGLPGISGEQNSIAAPSGYLGGAPENLNSIQIKVIYALVSIPQSRT